ncbi:MAG: hypothetical protein RJB13_42 [Pseudomonadota bacterium]
MMTPRLAVYLGKVSLILGSLAALSCSVVLDQQLADRVDSPLTLASHPSKAIGYVLNAVLGAAYENGSLQSYSVATSQIPQLLKSESTPRLGSALAVEKSGAFLLAGFSGSNSYVRLYNLDSQGIASGSNRSSDVVYLGDRRIKSIQVSKVSGEADWSVAVSSNLRTSASSVSTKLDVFRYSSTEGFSKLLTAPDDFYTPTRDGPFGAYSLSWNAPIIFESLGLAVAFPQSSSGYQGSFPTAFEWLSGDTGESENADLRIVSALAIDLRKLFAGSSAETSIGYIPLAFTKNGLAGNAALAADAPENEDLRFRVNYSAALALDSTNSPCQLNAPLQALKVNSAVVAYGSKSSVVSYEGFDQVASQLRTQLNANEKQPVLGQLLKAQPVAMAVAGDPDGIISQFSVVKAGALCTVGWLRTERGLNSLGAEGSLLQIASALEPGNYAKIRPSLKGTVAWSVINGSSLLTGSFGANQLQQFEFDGSSLTEGGKYP